MKLYAEVGSLRARQVAADAGVLAWVCLWVGAGFWIRELVGRLAGPGEAVERAGRDLARPLHDAARAVAGVPVGGEALRAPFDAAAEAAIALAEAGSTQVEAVRALAFWLGLLVAVIPISLLLLRFLPSRLRWCREATAADRILLAAPDLELFALRAVATRPLSELRRAAPNPAAALARGDFEALAAIELRALGLRAAPGRSRGRPPAGRSDGRRDL